MATGKLASLIIKISANGAEAEKELRTLEKKMGDFAKKAKNLGKSLSTYVTAPLVAMAGVSVAAADRQLQAEGRLLTALEGREDVQQRLIAQAAELQSRSLFGDETIIEQQAFLAALGLSERQITSTVNAAAQLSTALGIDLASATRNLAKTYSGLAGELGESIPALREFTTEQLKQGEAIAYINENYHGFAESAAETGTGPLVQLKNAWGDVAETLGTILLPAVRAVAEKLKSLAEWLQALSPGVQKAIVIVGGLAAAFGPLVLAIAGVASAAKVLAPVFLGIKMLLPALGAEIFAFISGPMTGLVAAIFAIVAAWRSAKTAAEDYARANEMANRGVREAAFDRWFQEYSRPIYSDTDLQNKIEQLRDENRGMIDFYERLARGTSDPAQKQSYQDAAEGLRTEVNAIEAVLEARRKMREDQAAQNHALSTQTGLIADLEDKVKSLNEAIRFADTEEEIISLNQQLAETNAELTRLKNLKPIEVTVATTIETNGANFGGVKLNTEAIERDVAKASERIGMWRMFQPTEEDIARTQELYGALTTTLHNSFSNIASAIGEGLGSLISGETFNPLQKLLSLIGTMLKELGTVMLEYSLALEAFQAAIGSLNPGLALAAGIALIAAGSAITALANKGPIKLATGGLAYGPTLAIVGDNPGASSDPEVVAPLSKLRNYMGGQQLELVGGVTFELRGDTARAILNRENVRLNRRG